MKRLFFIIALALHCVVGASAIVYVSADSLTLVNKPYPEGPRYRRVDVDRHDDFTPTVRRYYSQPTGFALTFCSDSPTLAFKWTTEGGGKQVNMPIIAQQGFDIYVDNGGHWQWAACARPSFGKTTHEYTALKNMADTMRTYMVYMPLFTELKSLEIGIDSLHTIKPAKNPWEKRVVALGSSITHGIGVSRPGMAYPARMERMLGVEICNLGASGQCKLETFFADVAADCDADAFIFDTFSNPDSTMIANRLIPFIEIVRKAHPTAPLIFLQTLDRDTRRYDTKIEGFENAKQQSARQAMARALEQFNDIYFIDPGMPMGNDGEATVDGIHPSDMGHERILNSILPQISSILQKYGIVDPR